MKRLRQICAVTTLTILLTTVASAEEGILHPWYVPPPTTSPATSTSNAGLTATSAVNTDGAEPTTDLSTEIMLQLIQNMLALF
jgi:hypothetical protein